MNRMTYTLKSLDTESTAKVLLETLGRGELRDVASDLGIYCQTNLTNSTIIDRILCRVFETRRKPSYCGVSSREGELRLHVQERLTRNNKTRHAI